MKGTERGFDMPIFDVGYPKRTGDSEQDLINLYNFACELSDRLRYIFGQIEAPKSNEQQTDTE